MEKISELIPKTSAPPPSYHETRNSEPVQSVEATEINPDDILTVEEVFALDKEEESYFEREKERISKGRIFLGESGELSDIDLRIIANNAKLYRIRQRTQMIREKHNRSLNVKILTYLQGIQQEKPADNFTAAQYWEMALNNLNRAVWEKDGRGYKLTYETGCLLEMLCCYFAKDNDFYYYAKMTEKHSGERMLVVDGECDLNKGIAIFGPNGTGKSETLKAFRFNPRLSFEYIKAKTFPTIFNKKDHAGLEPYYRHIKGSPALHFGQKNIGLFIDDVSAEDIGVSPKYEKVKTVEKVMYNRWENLPKAYTHMTTNADRAELETLYGSRFESRMYYMNLLKFPENTPDFRKI